jgi:hypothetical protein
MKITLTLATVLTALALAGCGASEPVNAAQTRSVTPVGAVVPNACLQALNHADDVKSLSSDFADQVVKENTALHAWLTGQITETELADTLDGYTTTVDQIASDMGPAVTQYNATSAECRKLSDAR